MNNRIEVNDVPVTVSYIRLDAGDMYRLPSGGTCIYMVLSGHAANSVNLRTGMVFQHGGKEVVPLPAGTRVSITAESDNWKSAA